MSKPPKDYLEFTARFPELAESWDHARRAEENGPMDERTRRLVKLAIAVGAGRNIGSSTRKALSAGIPMQELEQVLALAASTIGLPTTVAAFQAVHRAQDKAGDS